MKLFKRNIFLILGLVVTITNAYGQVISKSKQLEYQVDQNVSIDLDSKYTNVEFELTDKDVVIVEALLEVEGLFQKEVEAYFNEWNFNSEKSENKIVISSFSNNNTDIDLKKHGYYEGYFLNTEQLNTTKIEIEALKKDMESSTLNHNKNYNEESKSQGDFDYDTYIEKGNTYIEQWENENNEKVGRRFYNKTKEERILLRKPKKEALPNLDSQPEIVNKATLKGKSKLPSTNVRALSTKRAIVQKTLKIKVPRNAILRINVRHGKVVFSEEIKNLEADLYYVLFQANKINGINTSIKGSYSNFEIEQWNNGKLDVVFSDFVLINEVKNMNITSNASTVSIDNITESIDVKGNFKMLSVAVSSKVNYINIDVEDSKKVWVKLPDSIYNLQYEGIESKLIHPEKFSLKTLENNPRKQIINNSPLKNNVPFVKIKSLSSVMQIYDIPWENLRIKSL